MASYLRLRQICLVARELEPVVDDVCAIFGVTVCHRDPAVGKYGLVNALFPFGVTFLEVVVPRQPNTAAGRFLDRFHDRGGYMAIFDCDDPERRGAHAESIGVRIASKLAYKTYIGRQLHPRDCRAAMIEFNHTTDGADIDGAYWPAGEHWQDFVRGKDVALAAIEIQSPRQDDIAAHWSRIVERPLAKADDGWPKLAFDIGEVCFAPAPEGSPELMTAIHVRHPEPKAVLAAAEKHGHPVSHGGFELAGVRFTV